MRRLAGLLVIILLVVGSAHHRPGHPIPPGHQTTTTTTTVPTTTVPTTTTTTQPTVISLTADWLITEDDVRSGFTVEANGHAIMIDGANLDWDRFEIRNAARIMWHGACGVSELTDGLISGAGVAGQTGFYPFHWHLCGDTTRGTLVQNVTVRDSVNRAFVPHGSNGITFLDDTCDVIRGECFWWDPPGTTGTISDNSDDITVDGLTAKGVYWSRDFLPCCTIWHRISAVILGSGVGNVMRNSHVSDVTGGANCAGFHWREQDNHNVENVGWTFEDNTATDDNCHGIAVWQNDHHTHIIDGFIGGGGAGGLDHGAYTTVGYEYRNVVFPGTRIHAVGWSMVDSSAGRTVARLHSLPGEPIEFTNVTFTSFDLQDAGAFGATYILNGSNLACADILYTNPHPDSVVVIDGQECP
jgi:hypothetical protein